MIVEKTIALNLLYDTYGKLLTDKQQEVFEYYYHEDYSYQEIADILEISRSGVYDTLKRACSLLEEYEEKLQFISKRTIFINELYALENEQVNKVIESYLFKGGKYE
ncbi:MAG TPA: sigma factor-like helix-turn-helix DNA-binding protein [Erysipelothrix sp.]